MRALRKRLERSGATPTRRLSDQPSRAGTIVAAGEHAGADHRARFRTEAEMVARLQHPNIVQIFDVGEQDGHPYIAFEFIEGKTLTDFAGREPQPARVAAELLEALARAMHYAHQH